jgi:uncharacterized membrane protein YkoI
MNPSKRKMYAVLAGVGISLGAAGIASAATASPLAPTAAAVVSAAPSSAASASAVSAVTLTTADDDTPSYTSSVTIAVAADGTKPTDAELQAVATVTADEATAAALANTPGTATETELKSVGGNVVYKVEVTATAGGEYDVIVDAGNASILDTHVDGGHGHGRHGNSAPSYTSSVTIAVAADGTKPTDAELQAVATVSADEATAAALVNTPGTATETELKSVGGNVVYKVEVTATAGGEYDVIVDAGNASILDTHLDGGHGSSTPSYTSSVTIAVAADGTKPTDAELQAVATVSADEATAAALANTPGTATETELKSVGGNVVYKVEVTATAGGEYDVIVDAGNASILDTHVDGGHGGHHHGGDDAADEDATATTTG